MGVGAVVAVPAMLIGDGVMGAGPAIGCSQAQPGEYPTVRSLFPLLPSERAYS